MTLEISKASKSDIQTASSFIKNIIAAGETYALDRNMSEQEIESYFFREGNHAYKAVLENEIVGVYYLRPNQSGGGDHVANAGFMVSEKARGKGVARAMAQHAVETAKQLGFEAMQFNFVVSVNMVAVKLWQSLGFEIVGTIPKGFKHPNGNKVDAFVMHKFL